MDFLGADSVAPVGVVVVVVSSAAVVGGGCLLSEELFPFSTLAERTGSEVLDCEPVLIESERVCTLFPLFPPLSLLLLLFSEGAGWFLSHVFIMDNPMELLLLVLLPPFPATG